MIRKYAITETLKYLFISLLNVFNSHYIFTSISAQLSCFDLCGMWVALHWYGLFEQGSVHKPTLSVAVNMGIRPGIIQLNVFQ